MQRWDKFICHKISGDWTKKCVGMWEIATCWWIQQMAIRYLWGDESWDTRMRYAMKNNLYRINWHNACTTRENVVNKIWKSIEEDGYFVLYPNKEWVPYVFTLLK